MDYGHIKMDLEKVKVIQEWRTLTNVKELCSFLGLPNYYRRFVESYSRKAVSLIELLKKSVTYKGKMVIQCLSVSLYFFSILLYIFVILCLF